jgi:hypothetical protein
VREEGHVSAYRHVPHPWHKQRQEQGPATTGAVRGTGLNDRIGLAITNRVGTMVCAYIFAVLALLSLPSVLSAFGPFNHTFPAWMVKVSIIALVAWVAQTFLQLVLLPIIIVGQNLQSKASDARAEQTFKDAEAVLAEALEIQKHLASQDEILARQDEALAKLGVSAYVAGTPAPNPAAPKAKGM